MDYSVFFDVLSELIGYRDELMVVSPEHFDGTDDYRVSFSWKLNSAPNRPNKRSKSLIIIISQEALENFKDASEHIQKNAIANLKNVVSTKLQSFDPEHDSPMGVEEPVERIIIKSEEFVLN